MFCATFYSYKGGVGRTLALANVAAALAQKGRRVLVVDFDLEAPGLTTLPPFASATDCRGVIDFVGEFIVSGKAPNPQDFIRSCELVDHTDDDPSQPPRTFSIDVMPAGSDGDSGYANRLASIDWNDLYLNRDGFLLMENLRAAWEDAGYDYVLIDSRTGHTDVGGICTRQLPDAVVAVFFPNEQNLVGLKQVIQSVRTAGARPRPIELTFVASRVPRLDDEHGHLKHWLDRFQSELDYPDDRLTLVQHYDSLMLLNQALFVLDRPRTGLSQQYKAVAASIARLNPEDADGALDYLAALTKSRLGPRSREADMATRWNDLHLDAIAGKHATDAMIQLALARTHYRARNLLKVIEACTLALSAGGKTRTSREIPATLDASARQLRLKAHAELGRAGEAIDDAKEILKDNKATSIMLVDAVLAIASTEPEALKDPLQFPALQAAEPRTLIKLAIQLAEFSTMSEVAAQLAEEALRDGRKVTEVIGPDQTDVQLVLIAGGHFEAAVRAAQLAGWDNDIQVMFNTAMAHWGQSGRPDHGQFRALAHLFDEEQRENNQPNWYQCNALTRAVLREFDLMEKAATRALQLLAPLKRKEFSCWSYTQVTKPQFEEHVAAIIRFGHGEGPPPEVFTRAPARL